MHESSGTPQEYPTCPRCGEVVTECEDWAHTISLWGDDGTTSWVHCEECYKDFEVHEDVVRTWTSVVPKDGEAHENEATKI